MQATSPQIMRGIRTYRILQGGPRRMKGKLDRFYAGSEVTSELHEFWCHSWHIHPLTKYLSVLFLNNGLAAFVVEL